MKPARESASSRPKPCVSLKTSHKSCPFAAPWGPRRNKKNVFRYQLSLKNLPVRAFDSCAQGFSTPLARRQSSCPASSPNLMRTHSIERYQALRDGACLSRATAPPEGHQIGARKRCAPGSTIFSQPYRRRVSTDKLNRESSQLTASLEVESGSTPAGKTLPHS